MIPQVPDFPGLLSVTQETRQYDRRTGYVYPVAGYVGNTAFIKTEGSGHMPYINKVEIFIITR